jgi:hypothetical protein
VNEPPGKSLAILNLYGAYHKVSQSDIVFNIIYIMRSTVWGYLFKQVSPSCRQNGKHRPRRISQKCL